MEVFASVKHIVLVGLVFNRLRKLSQPVLDLVELLMDSARRGQGLLHELVYALLLLSFLVIDLGRDFFDPQLDRVEHPSAEQIELGVNRFVQCDVDPLFD